jgi:DNA-binding NarL/FixJ family response regulator
MTVASVTGVKLCDDLLDVGLTGEALSNDGASTTRDTIRVWLVDDDDHVREPMADLLNRDARIFCPRQFASTGAALEALKSDLAPDVILLDLNLRGECGLDAIRPMLEAAPSVRILMFTTFFDSRAEAEALAAGAAGFLLKSFEITQITQAIEMACDNPKPGALFSSSAARRPAKLRNQTAVPAVTSVCPAGGPKPFRFLRALLAMLTI